MATPPHSIPTHSQVLLPPSRSITLAQRRLAQLPTGGGTPLAHGLMTAARVALNAEKTGASGGGGVGRARVVCLTDGAACYRNPTVCLNGRLGAFELVDTTILKWMAPGLLFGKLPILSAIVWV